MNIERITLEAFGAAGKKFYTIDINQAGNSALACTVDFTYGAVGGSIKTGTKTPVPVAFEVARATRDKLVREKINGESRYYPVDTTLPEMQPLSPAPFVCLPPRLLNDADPSLIASMIESNEWHVQLKHDGDRVQLHVVNSIPTLFSARSGKQRPLPSSMANASFPDCDIVLDGELVGDVFWVFDLLRADTPRLPFLPSVAELDYSIRMEAAMCAVYILDCPSIRLVDTATTKQAKIALIAAAKAEHKEGVVFIFVDSPYTAGRPARGGFNLRWKFKASCSVLVSGHNLKSSVQVQLGDGSPIGTVTIPKGERPPVGSIIEVEYLYCQAALVQGVFKGVRHDLNPGDCTRAQLQFKDGIDPKAGVCVN